MIGWAARAVAIGAGVLVASLFLHRVEPRSFEDFYSIYGGQLGIPETTYQGAKIDPLPGWFFAKSAFVQVVLAAIAWRLATTARLRPDLAAADKDFVAKCVVCAIALVLWTLGTVVLYPGVLDPWVDQNGPFTRLAGTWVAAAAAAITAAGLACLGYITRGFDGRDR